MRRGHAAPRIVGACLLILGSLLVFALLAPPPLEVLSAVIGGDQGVWYVQGTVPRFVLAGKGARIDLVVSPTEDKEASGMLLASLSAPAAAVSPPGDQLGPAGDRLRFRWSVRAGEAGKVEVSPSIRIRSPSEGDRLLWAETHPVRVWAVLGLGAGELAWVAVGALVLGGIMSAIRLPEKTSWN